MQKSRFSIEQIVAVLKQVELGMLVGCNSAAGDLGADVLPLEEVVQRSAAGLGARVEAVAGGERATETLSGGTEPDKAILQDVAAKMWRPRSGRGHLRAAPPRCTFTLRSLSTSEAKMAHAAQLEYVTLLSKNLDGFFYRSKVVEIGSLDISGSVRSLFTDCDYVGLDVGVGKGVDVVCEGQKYDAPDATFDVAISCEAMEHNPYWAETFRNMIRLCRPGGLVIMTCATTGRPVHGTAKGGPEASPLTVALGWDYYKNLTKKDFERAADIGSAFSSHWFWTNWNHFDLLFFGIRKGGEPSEGTTEAWENVSREIDAWLKTQSGGRVHAYRAFAAKTVGDRWFRLMHRTMDTLSWLHKSR